MFFFVIFSLHCTPSLKCFSLSLGLKRNLTNYETVGKGVPNEVHLAVSGLIYEMQLEILLLIQQTYHNSSQP